MVNGTCPNRAESPAMNTKAMSLVLQNYFHNNPNVSQSCVDNSASLKSMMKTCSQAAGDRWPNFIAVDFYQVPTFGKIIISNSKLGNIVIILFPNVEK